MKQGRPGWPSRPATRRYLYPGGRAALRLGVIEIDPRPGWRDESQSDSSTIVKGLMRDQKERPRPG